MPVLVFAGLVIATFAAFFVTTRLKRAAPVIEQLTFRRSFSPNGDGRFDTAVFAFRLRRSDDVTVSIVKRNGDEIRTLVEDVFLERGRSHRFHWNGRNDAGQVAPDGEYHLRVGLRSQGRTVTSSRKLFLDTKPPRMIVRYVSPDSISPDGAGRANSAVLRFTGPSRRAQLLVFRTDVAKPRVVARRAIPRGDTTVRWNGQVTGGKAAPSGSYLLVVRAQDAAGNVGPRRIPPRRDEVRGHPGVAVRYLSARATRSIAFARGSMTFQVLADGRRYRWRVRRLGTRRVLARGSSRGRTLTVPVRMRRAGTAILDLRVGTHRYATPFPVAARGTRRVLVVLPELTWQARNPLESNGDGYPDTLPEESKVSMERPFAGDGSPPGFAGDASALLRFLDSERLRYDIVSDAVLARVRRAPIGRYDGMLFAGVPRFSTQGLQRQLRSWVERGGRIAWLGRGGFGWTADFDGKVLSAAQRNSRGLFGERLQAEPESVPTIVLVDRIGFFGGVGGTVPMFGPLEEAVGRLRPGSVLAAAGTAPERAALVVYRRDRGVVARIGIDGFGRALRTSPAAERIMRRLWVLLSR